MTENFTSAFLNLHSGLFFMIDSSKNIHLFHIFIDKESHV